MKSWPKVKLGEVAPTVSAAPVATAAVWLLNLDAIESGTGAILRRDVVSADKIGGSTVWFDEKNVLYSKLRPYLNKVVLPDEPGCATSELWPLRPLEERLSRTFLTHFLRSKAFVAQISEKVAGAKMPRVVAKEFRETLLPLPPLAEQERIASELDAVAATLKKRQAQLAELDALVESRFVELFGDPAKDLYCWKTKKLNEFYDIIDGDRGKNYPKQEEFASKGFCLFLNAKNVTQSGFCFVDCQFITREKDEILRTGKLERNDIVLTTRGTIGNVAYYDSSAPFEHIRINSGMVLLRKRSEILPSFFIEFFRRFKTYRRLITGTAQPQLPISLLKKIDIPSPPLDLQERFATEVKRIETLKTSVRNGIAETQTLFDALTARYFG